MKLHNGILLALLILSSYILVPHFSVSREDMLKERDSKGVNDTRHLLFPGRFGISGLGITVDVANNIYIVGRKDLSLFVGKYQTGNEGWNQTWGGATFSRGWDIVTDNEYLYTIGDLFPSGIGMGESGLLLIKWDTTGNMIWDRTWINPHRYGGRGIAIDGEGSIYTIGINGSQAILMKWDSSGTRLWNRTWASPYCSEVAVDGNGDIVTAGVFLIKWNQAGQQLWNKTLGFTTGLEVDAEESLYTTGLLLRKWNTDGNQLWNRTQTPCLDRDVALSNDGGVYTIGSIPPEYWKSGKRDNTNSIVLKLVVSTLGSSPWVVTRWDTNGNYIGNITTETEEGIAWGIVTDNAGYIHCVGERWIVTNIGVGSGLVYEIFSPLPYGPARPILGLVIGWLTLMVLTFCLLVFCFKKIKNYRSRKIS